MLTFATLEHIMTWSRLIFVFTPGVLIRGAANTNFLVFGDWTHDLPHSRRATIKPPMTSLYTDVGRVVWTLDSVWGYIYSYDIVIPGVLLIIHFIPTLYTQTKFVIVYFYNHTLYTNLIYTNFVIVYLYTLLLLNWSFLQSVWHKILQISNAK